MLTGIHNRAQGILDSKSYLSHTTAGMSKAFHFRLIRSIGRENILAPGTSRQLLKARIFGRHRVTGTRPGGRSSRLPLRLDFQQLAEVRLHASGQKRWQKRQGFICHGAALVR